MGLLDKLFFWRDDDASDHEIDGCFTLPGAELGDDDDRSVPTTDEAAGSDA